MCPTMSEYPGSAAGLRAANRDRVLVLLRAEGPMSQAELARASALSPATISSIVRELRDDGWLETAKSAPARGSVLTLSRSAGFAVGVDFGHTHVRVAISDLAHTVVGEAEEPQDVDQSAAEGVTLAARLMRGLLAHLEVPSERVMAVGMGLPGPLRRETREVGDSAILPGWIGTQPEQLMHTELRLPVLVDNDANLGALAELVWGAGRGCSDLVYIKVASGVGAGLVLGGDVYRGFSGTAGEIGHFTIDETGPICRCGNRGCLEAFVGAEGVLEPLRRRYGEELTLREVIDRALDGDTGCRRVIADAGRTLGVTVAGLCNLLGPEVVIVGGDLARAGDLLLAPIRGRVTARAAAPPRALGTCCRRRPGAAGAARPSGPHDPRASSGRCAASAPRCWAPSHWCCAGRGASWPSHRRCTSRTPSLAEWI